MHRLTLSRSSLAVLTFGLCGTLSVPYSAYAVDVVPETLVARAQSQGTVRVIVRFDLGFRPEGALSGVTAVTEQREDIDAAQNRVLSKLDGLRYRVLRQYESVPMVAVELNVDGLSAIETLAPTGLVASIVEDRLSKPFLAESTPLIGVNNAWNAGTDGAGAVIAVLDTGVDKTHPFLSGAVIDEACYSATGDCPNGQTSQVGMGAGIPCTYAPSACEHGTHVAGIAAGYYDDTFSGVAKRAFLMSIQVFSQLTSEFCGGGEEPCAGSYDSDLIAALERVYLLRNTYNFAAVNMSLGGGAFTSNCNADPMKPAIDNLRSAGIATVVASGNDGYSNALAHPACISSAVSVGSIGDGSEGAPVDEVSLFSNSASFLSLLAPGERIYSSIPGGGYASFQGTSMAAPHVAGAWAIHKQANPSASVSSILGTLRNTGVPVTDPYNGITTSRIAFTTDAEPAAEPEVLCEGVVATRVGSAGNDIINGTAGADVIAGLGGNDTINGLGGNDLICGESGNDIVIGSIGNDRINGGAGLDTAMFSSRPVAASLATRTASGEGSDTLVSIENLTGSRFADTLTGNNGPNVLSGGLGSDKLNGLGGNDTIDGAGGNDTMNGGSGIDSCNGGPGLADNRTACERWTGVP